MSDELILAKHQSEEALNKVDSNFIEHIKLFSSEFSAGGVEKTQDQKEAEF